MEGIQVRSRAEKRIGLSGLRAGGMSGDGGEGVAWFIL